MSVGKVWLVGAGPGDPALITVRGRDLLASAEVVLHDALSHPALLEVCGSGAEIRNVGKRGGRQSPSQTWITDQLIELARAGKRVVRLKGGDSFLFARGAEEAEALAAAGVPFEVVPGLASPMGVTAYAGIPLTHRDLSSSVTFISGTDRAGEDWSSEAWQRIALASDTLCVLMGMRQLSKIADAVMSGGRSPETPAAVITWGARPEQRVVTATLATIAARVVEAGLQNPGLIVIGDVVRLRERLRWYDNRPLFGRRVLVPRAAHQAAGTARALFDRGAAPVVFPVIDIVDPPDPSELEAAVRRLGEYDWVLFTSANGIERSFDALARAGLDARAFGRASVGVIGPRTAEALLSRGIRPDAVAQEYTGEGLSEALAGRAMRKVLLLRALVARDALPEALRARGVHVDVVAAYRTMLVPESRAGELARLIEDREVDVVLFTSSSTVESVVAALGTRAQERLRSITVASIGPITTSTAERLGLRVDVSAAEHTLSGLLDALEDHFRR